jgi:hypothetical protein
MRFSIYGYWQDKPGRKAVAIVNGFSKSRKNREAADRAPVGEFGDAAADRKAARSATIEYAALVADRCLLQSTI